MHGLSALHMMQARGFNGGVYGLGEEPGKRAQAQQKLTQLTTVVNAAADYYAKYKDRLKADKNWWADNYDAKKKEIDEFIADVQAKIAATSSAIVDAATVWFTTLDRLDRDIDGWMKFRDTVRAYERAPAQKPAAPKPPPSSAPPASSLPTPPPDQAPTPDAAAGGSNTMMYVGLGVAALLVVMAFSSKE